MAPLQNVVLELLEKLFQEACEAETDLSQLSTCIRTVSQAFQVGNLLDRVALTSTAQTRAKQLSELSAAVDTFGMVGEDAMGDCEKLNTAWGKAQSLLDTPEPAHDTKALIEQLKTTVIPCLVWKLVDTLQLEVATPAVDLPKLTTSLAKVSLWGVVVLQ